MREESMIFSTEKVTVNFFRKNKEVLIPWDGSLVFKISEDRITDPNFDLDITGDLESGLNSHFFKRKENHLDSEILSCGFVLEFTDNEFDDVCHYYKNYDALCAISECGEPKLYASLKYAKEPVNPKCVRCLELLESKEV